MPKVRDPLQLAVGSIVAVETAFGSELLRLKAFDGVRSIDLGVLVRCYSHDGWYVVGVTGTTKSPRLASALHCLQWALVEEGWR
jgi:hypothetical protein